MMHRIVVIGTGKNYRMMVSFLYSTINLVINVLPIPVSQSLQLVILIKMTRVLVKMEVDVTNLGDVLVEFIGNGRTKVHGELRFEVNELV